MRLSAAIASDSFKFDQREVNGQVEYLPFAGCLMNAFPGVSPRSYPLAFEMPLFSDQGGGPLGDSADNPFWDLVPDGARPTSATIFFVADVIDCLRMKKKWNKPQIAEWVRGLEEALIAKAFDMHGRRSFVTVQSIEPQQASKAGAQGEGQIHPAKVETPASDNR